ncbi:MAG TPA: hypothetical protein PKJ41_04075 [Bryobacteraceae bacterium]|nr:hypothetical protein [Bryobacteraceae bacterium]HPT24768.1 hypothetical protein [Bryobacteraceae bacterium]
MTIAVVISSLALLIGALSVVGLYRAVRRLEAELLPLFPLAMSTLDQAQQTLAVSLTQIEQLSAKAHAVLDSSKQQLEAFSETRGEFTQRLRAQAERLELVLDDTVSRLHEVVGVVHSGVMTPVREVSGVLSGIRTAFQTLLRNRRPSVDRATHDEEMFI